MFYFLHLKNNDLLTFSGLIKAYRLSFIKFDLTYHKYNNDYLINSNLFYNYMSSNICQSRSSKITKFNSN